ncbi:hypothetical protein BD310DRAFT_435882 [Dichomitus squalens]|uniref:Uncharacterized protein n=1 Tax=Dichomitus squalens TaxID=114155 RepID=A0A4Q9PWW6_9APHY|nr:hypothetical protein BD310DRAFT_435882 [Dichomitus squalens]
MEGFACPCEPRQTSRCADHFPYLGYGQRMLHARVACSLQIYSCVGSTDFRYISSNEISLGDKSLSGPHANRGSGTTYLLRYQLCSNKE